MCCHERDTQSPSAAVVLLVDGPVRKQQWQTAGVGRACPYHDAMKRIRRVCPLQVDGPVREQQRRTAGGQGKACPYRVAMKRMHRVRSL